MSFTTPYAWYQSNYVPDQFDEAGQPIWKPISEDAWNAMSEDTRRSYLWSAQGNNGFWDSGINDRYRQSTGRDAPAGFSAVDPRTQDSAFFDPRAVWTDPGSGQRFTTEDNKRPSKDILNPAVGVGLVLGAGLLNNFLMSGNLLGGAPNIGMELGVGASPGSGASLGGAAELATVGETGGTLLGGAAPANVAVYGGTGGLGLQLHNLTGGLSGLFNGAGLEETLGSFGNSLSGLLSSATSNPLTTLNLLSTGADLLGGRGDKPNPSGGGGDGPKGGSGLKPQAASRGVFQPNPFTSQQIANYQPVRRPGL